MNQDTTRPTCPTCGSAMAHARGGVVCPACLLQVGFHGNEFRSTASPSLPTLGEIQALFPDLDVIDLIGQGGMGAVYQVRQPRLERFAALKILPRDLAAQPGFRQRFHTEARTMAALNHPNIVTIHESGERDDLFFFLMEYVDGGDLGRAIRSESLKPGDVLSIIPQICDALQYAHESGVVHRDIKPGNILLDSRGRVKVADFGIAKMVGTAQDSPFPADYLLGTPEYMAPEQRDGSHDIDHRADIYSLGAVFYELLTGRHPPVDGIHESPSKPSGHDSRLDEVVLRAMAADRSIRFQQANEIRREIETITRPRSRVAWPIGVGLIVATGIIATALLQRDRTSSTAEPFPPAWENSLGMKFRPIPGTDIRMSIWETRVSDWLAFEKSNVSPRTENHSNDSKMALNMNDSARIRDFCDWLTRTERAAGRISANELYRLPTDHEWSLAAGFQEPVDSTPEGQHLKDRSHYPWGTLAPAPAGAGNYADSALRERIPNAVVIPNYYDGHSVAAPVGSFPANSAGFHDLGGNLWEAVTTSVDDGSIYYRGGSWFSGAKDGDWSTLLSSFRAKRAALSHLETGFRVVLAMRDSKIKPDLVTAARDGDLKTLNDLIAAGASLKQQDALDRTALHHAALNGHTEIVSALIKAGANVESVDQSGNTPLHMAAKGGFLPVMESLLRAGAELNSRNKFIGTQPIHLAASGNHVDALEFLASHGAELMAKDNFGNLPLHCAAAEGADKSVEWLINHKTPIDTPGGLKMTALGLAAQAGHEMICALLLRLGASPDPNTGSILSPLASAATIANPNLVRLLLDHGADPKPYQIGMAIGLDLATCQLGNTGDGSTGSANLKLLSLPSKPGNREQVIRLLVEKGMSLEQKNPKGFTPLLNAAYQGNIEAVQILLALGANPDAVDGEGFTALHSAAEKGFVKVVELLLAKGVKTDLPNGVGRTALDCATVTGNREVALRLLNAGANVEGLPRAASTPLTSAAENGRPEILKLFLEHHANPNAIVAETGFTPLLGAAAGPERGKSSRIPPGAALPLLGTPEEYHRCVQILLDHGADIHATMHDGTTALHAAADFNQTDTVKLLLERGLKPDIVDNKAFTPMHRAAQRDSADAAAILLEHGAQLSHPINPSTPLHVAAASGSSKVASLLLERGANPNLRDGKNATPLHWAVSLGHTEIVRLLAKYKADLTVRDFVYNTPLHCAVISGKPEIVRTLLDAGADPDLRNVEGATPLDIATFKHLNNMVLILSAKKPSPRSTAPHEN